MFMCIYVVGEFSYMLLVLICWCKHVLEYVGVDLWNLYEICFVVVGFHLHVGGEYLCIQLCGVIMMCLLYQGRRPRR